jgi:hypothetical protein
MAAERQRECADDHDEQLQHAVIVAGVGARFNSDEFWRCSVDRTAVWDLVRVDNCTAPRPGTYRRIRASAAPAAHRCGAGAGVPDHPGSRRRPRAHLRPRTRTLPCRISQPSGSTWSSKRTGAQHRTHHSHHRAASANSSSRDSERPGSCRDSDTASVARSAFGMSPRRGAHCCALNPERSPAPSRPPTSRGEQSAEQSSLPLDGDSHWTKPVSTGRKIKAVQ